MRQGLKTLPAAALLALGLAACGSGGSGSTTTEAASTGKAESSPSVAAKQGKAKSGGEAKPGSGGGKSNGPGGEEAEAREAAEFTPKRHHDSGGGSSQFIVKGNDNSVQEFGAEASEGELQVAASALHGFLDARAQGNWAAACEYMAKSVTESLEKLASQAKPIEGKGCPGILEKLTNPAARSAMKQEAEKADVGSLRVEGDRSFVIYRGPKGAILAMPMADEAGAWKVASLAGTPLN